MDDGLLLLNARRINEQTIAVFNIQPNGTGWLYPVIGGGQRWKSYDSHSQTKYRWFPNKPVSAKLYHAPDLQAAIQAAGGVCWYVSGEADVWAMHSAGIKHVLSGFGESHVVPDLVSLLGGFGVKTVYIAPDLDDTGEWWARKVSQRLNDCGISFEARQLPETLGHNGDIGLAWQVYRDTDSFELWLVNLPKLQIKHERTPLPASPKFNDEVVPIGYRELVAKELGVDVFHSNGNSRDNVLCPFHDDHNPSASLHQEKGLYCYACGKSFLWKDVGRRLGLGSISEWYLAQQRITPCQLSTEMREALMKNGHTNFARVYDALILAGWKSGKEFTVKEAARACAPYGIPISCIYKITNAKNRTYSPFFPTTIVLNKKGEKTVKKCRPRRLLRLLSPQEIGRLVDVYEVQYQHYDTMSPDKLANVAGYRAEVYAAMLRRRPGCYPRSFLGKRMGVTPRTTLNYDKLANICVKSRYRKERISFEKVAKYPNERRDVPGNVWLEDATGKRYQATKSGAVRAFERSNNVFRVEQLANYYGPKQE